MRIVVDRSKPKKIVKVQDATYLKDFVLRIGFSDGTKQVVDFKDFLEQSSHPDIRKYYLKESKFKKFEIDGGTINWNDYELFFPFEDLYNGKIS